jgi:hypothetical protein
VLAQFLGTPKKRIIAGVVAAVLLAGGLGIFLASRGDEEAAPTTTTTTTTTTAAPTTTVPAPVAPLTGMPGDFGDRLSRPAVFVKIDNAPQARPQAGMLQADLVIEEQVEGSTSRLINVFHSTDAVEIGPVRSTRSTDLGLVPLFGRPLYASSGGNGNVLRMLGGANVVDIGHNVSGQGFRRVSGRRAPHNLFTTLGELYAKAPEQPPPPVPIFNYRVPNEPLAPGAELTGGVALSFGRNEISRFTWDAATKTWPRSELGSPHVDPSGKQAAPRNVVVLEIGYDFSGAGGQSVPHGMTIGSGRAYVFTNGHVIPGTWVRPGPNNGIQLLAGDGTRIKLTPGQTWLELPPGGGTTLL